MTHQDRLISQIKKITEGKSFLELLAKHIGDEIKNNEAKENAAAQKRNDIVDRYQALERRLSKVCHIDVELYEILFLIIRNLLQLEDSVLEIRKRSDL